MQLTKSWSVTLPPGTIKRDCGCLFPEYVWEGWLDPVVSGLLINMMIDPVTVIKNEAVTKYPVRMYLHRPLFPELQSSIVALYRLGSPVPQGERAAVF
jgi:hypothetical protein